MQSQTIIESCREEGLCVLTREQFEETFLRGEGDATPNLSRFCLSNDLELIVDAEARRFVFVAGHPGLWKSWCERPVPRPGDPTTR